MQNDTQPTGAVTAVCRSETHTFSKPPQSKITLLTGLGVKGDAHCGKTVKHRSRVAADPSQPNLRQVHLIHEELHQELAAKGFNVSPGVMGENITTRGIDLLGLPCDTVLEIGADAKIRITGLRNPCRQLDDYQKGLFSAVLDKTENGALVRKSGVMGVIISSGDIRAGDLVAVKFPPQPFLKLEPV